MNLSLQRHHHLHEAVGTTRPVIRAPSVVTLPAVPSVYGVPLATTAMDATAADIPAAVTVPASRVSTAWTPLPDSRKCYCVCVFLECFI